MDNLYNFDYINEFEETICINDNIYDNTENEITDINGYEAIDELEKKDENFNNEVKNYYPYTNQLSSLDRKDNNSDLRINNLLSPFFIKSLLYKSYYSNDAQSYIYNTQNFGNDINLFLEEKYDIIGGYDHRNKAELKIGKEIKSLYQKHFKICTKEGFLASQTHRVGIFTLLKLIYTSEASRMSNHEYKPNNKRLYIPKEIFQKIYEYIKEEPKFTLYNISNTLDVYIRVTKMRPLELKPMTRIKFGVEHRLEVVRIGEIPTNSFYESLFTQMNNLQKLSIFGLNDYQLSELDYYIHYQYNSNEYPEMISEFSYPFMNYIIIKVILKKDQHDDISHVLIVDQGSEFTLGRTCECDMVVEAITVSTVQFRIKYMSLSANNPNKSWCILDGTQERQSLNGTWYTLPSITNNDNDNDNENKNKGYILHDDDEIKVNTDYMMRFNILKLF